jgi:hypothetical protein
VKREKIYKKRRASLLVVGHMPLYEYRLAPAHGLLFTDKSDDDDKIEN